MLQSNSRKMRDVPISLRFRSVDFFAKKLGTKAEKIGELGSTTNSSKKKLFVARKSDHLASPVN